MLLIALYSGILNAQDTYRLQGFDEVLVSFEIIFKTRFDSSLVSMIVMMHAY